MASSEPQKPADTTPQDPPARQAHTPAEQPTQQTPVFTDYASI